MVHAMHLFRTNRGVWKACRAAVAGGMVIAGGARNSQQGNVHGEPVWGSGATQRAGIMGGGGRVIRAINGCGKGSVCVCVTNGMKAH